MANSESDTEPTLHTEPSAGDADRAGYDPYRVRSQAPDVVGGFRRWWLSNPLHNLWTSKPNSWQTFQKIASGVDPAEAVKSGANVKLDDIVTRGPTMSEVLADGSFRVDELPSDEAWFGTPDPAVYAPGTNRLTPAQLADEVAKGSVMTLRQLKQHLATADEEELQAWQRVLMIQKLRDEAFLPGPDGTRISVWDMWNYVHNNPELAALAERDPNLAVPLEGLSREERIRLLAEVAPWKLCGNDKVLALPQETAARLAWGLLAAGSWFSRRPTRWLKGLDGVKDFDYGLYVQEEEAQALLGPTWGGRPAGDVLSNKSFYREALSQAQPLGMSLLAVASRPLPLEEVTQAWEQKVRQQIDRLDPPPAGSSSSSSSRQRMYLSSSSSAVSGSGSATETGSSSGSASEEGTSSSSQLAAHIRQPPAAARAAAAAPPAAAAVAQQQQPAAQRSAVQQPARQAAASASHAPAAPAAAAPARSPAAAAAASAAPSSSSSTPAAPGPAQLPPAAASTTAAAAAAGVIAPVHEIDARYASLASLVQLFDRRRLAEQTLLLDVRGQRLREGATIIFNAHPSGTLMVQAVSPGLVKEQQSYVLGSVHDPMLVQAMMALFMDPDETIDPAFTANAGSTLLAFANGHRTSSGPRQRLHGTVELAALQVASDGVWELPDVGKPPPQQPLVKGVRRAVMYQQIEEAFEEAFRAAAAVPVPDDADVADLGVKRSMVFARRHAAEKALKQRLGKLGLDTSGLSLPTSDVPADLLSLARPLSADTAAVLEATVAR